MLILRQEIQKKNITTYLRKINFFVSIVIICVSAFVYVRLFDSSRYETSSEFLDVIMQNQQMLIYIIRYCTRH